MMIRKILQWSARSKEKKNLLSFLDEMEKNLEFYYVMSQRQFITHGFLTEKWALVEDLTVIKDLESLRRYHQAIEDFNKTYDEYKSYEQWYSSDMKNKNNENAKKLHALKHGLDAKVKPMEALIILAGQDLEKELLKMGYISD